MAVITLVVVIEILPSVFPLLAIFYPSEAMHELEVHVVVVASIQS